MRLIFIITFSFACLIFFLGGARTLPLELSMQSRPYYRTSHPDSRFLFYVFISSFFRALLGVPNRLPIPAWREARYGLRGVIMGEASNPGPPKLVSGGVLASTGLALGVHDGVEQAAADDDAAMPAAPGPAAAAPAGALPAADVAAPPVPAPPSPLGIAVPLGPPPPPPPAPDAPRAPTRAAVDVGSHTGDSVDGQRPAAAARGAQGPLQCPLCSSYRTSGATRMLVLHIVRAHGGQALHPAACDFLHSLSRGICTSENCGGLREYDSAPCKRCNGRTPVRRLTDGDLVPLPSRAADPPMTARSQPTDGDALIPEAEVISPTTPTLPADLQERVQKLTFNTRLKVPPQFRHRLCDITSSCIEGANRGEGAFAVLDEACSKLLLAHIPKDTNTTHELRIRFDMWEAKDFDGLLARAETQARQLKPGRNESSFPRNRKRVRHSVRNGAYRKGLQKITSTTAQLTSEDEKRWARELLPDSARPAASAVPAGAANADAPPAVEDPGENHEALQPLTGVRFGPESAPGPSGRRPEHLQAMLTCRRRRSLNRLLRALHSMEKLALEGNLPDCWQWILGTRLVFIGKKNSTKPRPIRVGELWRRVIAKHALHRFQGRIRQHMIRARQFGVCVPGGTETLIHARSVLEECIQSDPGNGVWAVIDLDWANCYPSLEWDDIDDAMQDVLPEVAPWTRWCHQHAAPINLPSGGVHTARRGAEQGDPHGSLQCGLVLAKRSREALASLRQHLRSEHPGIFDAWYADDGQVLCRPAHVDAYLGAIDASVGQSGGTRGSGPDVKTVVRLVGHPDALEAFEASEEAASWITPRMQHTCRFEPPNSPIEVLGSVIGSSEARDAQFKQKIDKLSSLHAAIGQLEDPQIELSLGRISSGVSRVVHLLRTNGRFLSPDVVAEQDNHQSRFLSHVLAGDLSEAALNQAAAGVQHGGLGMRRASQLQSLAFAASRIEVRPFVARLYAEMADAGIAIPGCLELYDRQTTEALDAFVAGLDPARADRARQMCERAAGLAQARLDAYLDGRREDAPGAPVGDGHAGARLVSGEVPDDPEHPRAPAALQLQQALARLSDRSAMETLLGELDGAGRSEDVLRIKELQDESVSHEWLWSMGAPPTAGLEADLFVTAVRLRLGASHAAEPQLCQQCGAVLAPTAYHASCCAPGASTEGHNDVRDALLDLAKVADATSEPEVLGLFASAPDLRPADVLTSALGGNLSHALDVGIAAPLAANAGPDCTESMRKRKVRRYARWQGELEEQRITYRPLIWSAWGREHPDTSSVLVELAKVASRRRGLADYRPVLARARAGIGIAIARRAARMILSCQARLGKRQLAILGR